MREVFSLSEACTVCCCVAPVSFAAFSAAIVALSVAIASLSSAFASSSSASESSLSLAESCASSAERPLPPDEDVTVRAADADEETARRYQSTNNRRQIEIGLRHRGREEACADARFQHAAAALAEPLDAGPDCPDDEFRSEMRILGTSSE